MKALIYALTAVAVLVAITFAVLIYRQGQPVETPTPQDSNSTPVAESETDIAKRILIGQLDTSNLNPDEKAIAEASAAQQVEDDARLYEMAVAAGTTVSSSSLFFAWQREIYNHTDEAGLAAYISSLGLTEDTYRQLLVRKIVTATFIESKAATLITDADIEAYYNNLPADERDTFEMMEPLIRENLIAAQLPRIRQELLAQ
jgi:hypothetical protein